MQSYKALVPYANSDNQRRLLTYLAENPQSSISAAAKALGMPRNSATALVSRVRKRAAEHEPTAHIERAPEGYELAGVSTYDPETRQWRKTRKKKAQETAREQWEEMLKRVMTECELPAAPPLDPPPRDLPEHLLNVFGVGDAHIGLMADGVDSEDVYDTPIGAELHKRAFQGLVDRAPEAHTALLLVAGDYFHANDKTRKTRRSGHILDADPRYAYVLRTGKETLIYGVDLMLQTHQEVVVRIVRGNHDQELAHSVACMLESHYRLEPRVRVDTAYCEFWSYRHGQCLIGAAHGDTLPADKLPGVMTTRWRQEYGETKYNHWYTGHVHHQSVKDYPECTVETLRTLPPCDSYAESGGYRAPRGMHVDTWHAEKGYRGRQAVGIEDLTKP